jgi:hypothetical protein
MKYLALLFIFSACSRYNDKTQLMRAWDYNNSPERMGLISNEYDFILDQLPLEAYLSKKPWSGGYWPSYKGGLSYRWNHPSLLEDSRIYYNLIPINEINSEQIKYLSPTEKYDLILGQEEYNFTQKERKRTKVMLQQENNIPKWYGLCHAWAAATLFFDEPNPIEFVRKDGLVIPLGSSDIKALLIYFLHKNSGNTYFVSKRCDIDDHQLRQQRDLGLVSQEEYDEKMNSAKCRGINAGSFHVILSNMVGLRDEGFLFDRSRGAEVWNQAVHCYKSKIVDKITENFVGTPAPGTVEQIKVQTKMYYTSEISMSWEKTSPQTRTSKRALYTYWLELDSERKIIGGTWISEQRPDFLWNRTIPEIKESHKLIKDIYELATNSKEPQTLPTTTKIKNIKVRKQQTNYSTKIYIRGKANSDIEKVYIYTRTTSGKIRKKKTCYLGTNGIFLGKISFKTNKVNSISIVATNKEEEIKEQSNYKIAEI